MICDPEEFLLVAQKWATDSAKVIASLTVFDEPARPVCILRIEGRLRVGTDRTILFTFSGEGVFLIDLEQWTEMAYADKALLPESEGIDESLCLSRTGAMLYLWTLR